MVNPSLGLYCRRAASQLAHDYRLVVSSAADEENLIKANFSHMNS